MLNTCWISGEILSDPRYRRTNDGTPLCTFLLKADSSNSKREIRIPCKGWRTEAEKLRSCTPGTRILINASLSRFPHPTPEDQQAGRYAPYNHLVLRNFQTLSCSAEEFSVNRFLFSGCALDHLPYRTKWFSSSVLFGNDIKSASQFGCGLVTGTSEESMEPLQSLAKNVPALLYGTLDTYSKLDDQDQKRSYLLLRASQVIPLEPLDLGSTKLTASDR